MPFKPVVLLSGMWCVGLCFSAGSRAQTAPPPAEREEADQGSALFDWHGEDDTEFLHSPWSYGWFDYYHADYPLRLHIGRGELARSFRHGRATERYRQNVFELRRKLRERLQHTYSGDYDPSPLELNAPPGGPPYGRHLYRSPWRRHHRHAGALGEIWGHGRELEYHRQQELYLREQMTLLSYRDLLDRGLDLFRDGSYGQAARAFLAAADKNHEDAAARIHAAQALMAVGMYDQAMGHVRRAFELQPLLMQLPMNLADDYANQADYAEHLAALAAHVKAHPKDHEAAILLAYQRFFSDKPRSSSEAMKRLKPLARTDPFVAKLLAAAAPIVPDAR